MADDRNKETMLTGISRQGEIQTIFFYLNGPDLQCTEPGLVYRSFFFFKNSGYVHKLHSLIL